MIATLNNNIVVNVSTTPLKVKNQPSLYTLYLSFRTYKNKVETLPPTSFSLSLSVLKSEWNLTTKQVKGKSDYAKEINTKIMQHVNEAVRLIEVKFGPLTRFTPGQVKTFITEEIKPAITGKAARGQKVEYQNTLTEHTLEAVMKSYLAYRNPVANRQRQYHHALTVVDKFYKSRNMDTPLITEITEYELGELTTWFKNYYRTDKGKPPTKNSTTTWFCQIGAIFVHATKRLKILPYNPLPEGFRGSFDTCENREILSETEKMRIRDLSDNTLSHTEQVAKYCMILEFLTGMDYCDLETLTREHQKFDIDFQQWKIHKSRQKTEKFFKVPLTTAAKHALDKLKELSGGTGEYLLNLPSIEYTVRMFQVLADKAGITTNIGTKTLRHTFAMDYMNKDGKIEDLQVMLGHKNIKSTQVYGKVSDERLFRKMQELENKSPMHQHNN